MNSKLSILLIEDDVDTCTEIENSIANTDDMNLAGTTNNSNEALEMVQTFLPDVIILDLELHQGGGNGLIFLQRLKQLQLSFHPYILITTNSVSQMTFESARHLDADFILTKYETGYCSQYIIEFIRTMKPTIVQHKYFHKTPDAVLPPIEKERKLNQRIQRELDLIGISPKAIGFQYLIDAIRITHEKPEPNLSRILAAKYNKSSASIERAMQNAINRAWQTNSPDDLLKYYTARIRSDRGVPTLMEFIYYYASKLSI